MENGGEEADIVEDSDKESSFAASPFPLPGLSMLWKNDQVQQNVIDVDHDMEGMSPVIPTLNILSGTRRINSDDKDSMSVGGNKYSPSLLTDEEQSEILIPVNTPVKPSSNQPSGLTPRGHITESRASSGGALSHQSGVSSTERQMDIANVEENNLEDDETVDSHTTLGSQGKNEKKNEKSTKFEESYGLDYQDSNDNTQDIRMLVNKKMPSGGNQDGDNTTRDLHEGNEGVVNTDFSGKIQTTREKEEEGSVVILDLSSQDNLAEASQSQSLLDPNYKSSTEKATKRFNAEGSKPKQSLSTTSTNSQSSKSSNKSSDVHLTEYEETLQNHHSLEMDLMDKLDKHHRSASGLLKKGQKMCIGQVHNLLKSLAPLMDQLKTAHGHERKHVQLQRGKNLNKSGVTLLKLQISLLIEREKRLVKLNSEHNRLREEVEGMRERNQSQNTQKSHEKSPKIGERSLDSGDRFPKVSARRNLRLECFDTEENQKKSQGKERGRPGESPGEIYSQKAFNSQRLRNNSQPHHSQIMAKNLESQIEKSPVSRKRDISKTYPETKKKKVPTATLR